MVAATPYSCVRAERVRGRQLARTGGVSRGCADCAAAKYPLAVILPRQQAGVQVERSAPLLWCGVAIHDTLARNLAQRYSS